jgi:dsDNA-specific endonuclease/ATPase MutS2
MLLGEGNIMKFLDSEQREQIGFSFIIDSLQVMTPFGAAEKKNISPCKNRKELNNELNSLEAVIKSIEHNKKALGEIERVFCRVKDIKNTVMRLKNINTLDDVELYEIKYFALLIEELELAYKGLNLNVSTIKFSSLEEIIVLLDPEEKKLSTFYIYDSYSEKLKSIRSEKIRLENLIYRKSDSEELSKLKAERLNIVVMEEEEELSIRRQLTEKLSSFVTFIEGNIYSIGRLDFLIAKGKLAVKYGAVKPKIVEEMKISLKDIFNPEIMELLMSKRKNFTPISVELKSGAAVLTGANMGGKSVSLKTMVLNLILGQCGFFVFAKEAEIPILDFIYFISDDMQSISQGLSSFGAEIVKLKIVIEAAKRGNGFIALDEFARGTNPKEGFYLAKSICKYLNMLKSISVISTHYDGVADENIVHYQAVGLKNLDFSKLKHKIDLNKMKSIDIIQEHMDYRLERVNEKQEVPKDALNITILLGLQDEIIDIARDYYKEGEKHE